MAGREALAAAAAAAGDPSPLQRPWTRELRHSLPMTPERVRSREATPEPVTSPITAGGYSPAGGAAGIEWERLLPALVIINALHRREGATPTDYTNFRLTANADKDYLPFDDLVLETEETRLFIQQKHRDKTRDSGISLTELLPEIGPRHKAGAYELHKYYQGWKKIHSYDALAGKTNQFIFFTTVDFQRFYDRQTRKDRTDYSYMNGVWDIILESIAPNALLSFNQHGYPDARTYKFHPDFITGGENLHNLTRDGTLLANITRFRQLLFARLYDRNKTDIKNFLREITFYLNQPRVAFLGNLLQEAMHREYGAWSQDITRYLAEDLATWSTTESSLGVAEANAFLCSARGNIIRNLLSGHISDFLAYLQRRIPEVACQAIAEDPALSEPKTFLGKRKNRGKTLYLRTNASYGAPELIYSLTYNRLEPGERWAFIRTSDTRLSRINAGISDLFFRPNFSLLILVIDSLEVDPITIKELVEQAAHHQKRLILIDSCNFDLDGLFAPTEGETEAEAQQRENTYATINRIEFTPQLTNTALTTLFGSHDKTVEHASVQ